MLSVSSRFMNAMHLVVGFLLAASTAFAADSLTNPKDLVLPLALTRAEYYLDGGSIGGTLRDSRDKHLDFFFDRGDAPATAGNIYLGFVSGHIKDSMRARFNGWQADDLYTLIELTIRRQFLWDASMKRLRPRDPHIQLPRHFFVPEILLRHVEHMLHRERTYMK